jgi:hypothetical protein
MIPNLLNITRLVFILLSYFTRKCRIMAGSCVSMFQRLNKIEQNDGSSWFGHHATRDHPSVVSCNFLPSVINT